MGNLSNKLTEGLGETTHSTTESYPLVTNSPSDLKVLSKTTTSPPQTEVTNSQTHNKLVKINQVIKSSLKNGKVNPSTIAKFITTKYNFILDEETGILWMYNSKEGIYTSKSKIVIDKEIKNLLKNQCRARYSQDVEYNIRTTVPTGIMDTEKPELLAVQNGVLNIITKELKEFSPDFHITNKLPWKYDPVIKAEEWLKFLDSLELTPTELQQLKEIVGHCLYKAIITETITALIGKGSNGKSIFLKIIEKFFTKKNRSNITLQQLGADKFAIYDLNNIYAIICFDLPKEAIHDTGNIKAVVSGDGLPGNKKHVQGSFNVNLFCKIIASGNYLPQVTSEEDSDAWHRRFLIIQMKKKFRGKNKIPRQELLSKLGTETEMTGILNWALEGFDTLYKNSEITDKPDVEEAKKAYRIASSTVAAYFDNESQITDSSENWIDKKVCYRNYVAYCHKIDLPILSYSEFCKEVTKVVKGIYETRIRPDPNNRDLKIPVYQYVLFCPVEHKCKDCHLFDKCHRGEKYDTTIAGDRT